ncbi:plakophilin-4 isoform X5 [Tachysurus ichikawai]
MLTSLFSPNFYLCLRASFASQHSPHGADLRSTVSPDRHIGPIYEDRAFHGPLYRSPSHITHSPLYRSPSGKKLYTLLLSSCFLSER